MRLKTTTGLVTLLVSTILVANSRGSMQAQADSAAIIARIEAAQVPNRQTGAS